MKNWFLKHRQTILKTTGSLLAFGSLFFLARQQSWDEVLGAARQIAWSRFGIAAGLLMASRLFTVVRWHVLLRYGGVDIRFQETASLTFTGLFASNFLPTTIGGDIVRVGGAFQLGYDRAVCAASVVVDRLVGMLGMVMVLPWGLFSFSQWYAISSNPSLGVFSFGKLWQRTKYVFSRLLETIQLWFRKPQGLVLALFFSWGHMVCLFLSLLVIANGLGESISFFEMAGIWSLSYFITLLPVSINGYGMQELSLTYLLSNLGNMTLANSLVVAILIRIIFVLASLPGAIYLPTILSSIAKQRKTL